jgi:hypothetical protein
VDLVLGVADARSVSPSDWRVMMAHVALPRCGSMRVIPWPVSASPTMFFLTAKRCLLTTRAVAFYTSSEKLPVQKRQLLATQGSVFTRWDIMAARHRYHECRHSCHAAVKARSLLASDMVSLACDFDYGIHLLSSDGVCILKIEYMYTRSKYGENNIMNKEIDASRLSQSSTLSIAVSSNHQVTHHARSHSEVPGETPNRVTGTGLSPPGLAIGQRATPHRFPSCLL